MLLNETELELITTLLDLYEDGYKPTIQIKPHRGATQIRALNNTVTINKGCGGTFCGVSRDFYEAIIIKTN